MSESLSSPHPLHAAHSTTSHVVDQLELYGYRPSDDELDPRPLPETSELDDLISGVFAAMSEPLLDTCLESELTDLLWSVTDLLHRKVARVQRHLDDNEDRQKKAQSEQDGSEIRSVDLERLILQGQSLIDRRNAFEYLRERAADHFEATTGSSWRPRSGSLVNHKHLTAALIDSRDFIAAKRIAETQVHVPKGSRVAFAGGIECNEHDRIWATLDRVLAKYPDMVLMHGGTPRGAERIASCWAESRKVTQITFKPEWTRDGKAAPFKRNDRMLDVLPIGVLVFPGSGITDNLADKAKKLRIPIWDYRKGGA